MIGSVVISSGHGKHIRGAAGPAPWGLDEVDEARRTVERVAEFLRGKGVKVKTFHDDISDDQSENLHRIVDYHNAQTRDLDVSVHFNAYETTSQPMGTECLFVTQDALAADVAAAIADAGDLLDRGAKYRGDLFFLNQCIEPAILIEVAFVDSEADADLYRDNFDAICKAIAKAIIGQPATAERPPRHLLPPLSDEASADICDIAEGSEIARYNWQDRGVAPAGYIQGMAIAFADASRRWRAGDPAAREMAKANTGNADKDVLEWYAEEFADLGMGNDTDSLHTLRHLFAFMIGLGMRETSGQHCCGRDQSADNTNAMTCEAGLFQMSWNASSCSDQMQRLFEQYQLCPSPQCGMEIFSQDVTCDADDWENYGSGDGEQYQLMAKNCPVFAVHTAAICLRNLRQHFGPVNRREVELMESADDMLQEVQNYLDDDLGDGRRPAQS